MKLLLNTIVSQGTGLNQDQFIAAIDANPQDIDGVEIRYELLPEDEQARESAIEHILKAAERHDWELYLSVPEPLFLPEGLNPLLEGYLQVAQALTARSVKINTGDHEGMTVGAKEELAMLQGQYPFGLTIENDQTPENGSSQRVRQVLERIAQLEMPVGYTFDLGNWQYMGEDPQAMFAELKERITVFHMKNMVQQQTYLLDEGAADWREFVTLPVPYILEYPMTLEQLPQEIEKIRQVAPRD